MAPWAVKRPYPPIYDVEAPIILGKEQCAAFRRSTSDFSTRALMRRRAYLQQWSGLPLEITKIELPHAARVF